jgi:hypothetical protein
MIELLDMIYEKASKTFYKSNKSKLTELKERLEQLRTVKAGGVVIDLADGGKLIIHTMGSES